MSQFMRQNKALSVFVVWAVFMSGQVMSMHGHDHSTGRADTGKECSICMNVSLIKLGTPSSGHICLAPTMYECSLIETFKNPVLANIIIRPSSRAPPSA